MTRFHTTVDTESFTAIKDLTSKLLNTSTENNVRLVLLLENFIELQREERKEKNDPRFKSWKHKKCCFGIALCWAYDIIKQIQNNSA
jgi:hypothetical protein